jgi:(4S)-4-hydroxy-5-phosphonooxypentane-2,3-dione isomerase
MYIVHVHIHVKPDLIEAFKQASLENARCSIQEPGIMSFDVLQQADDPTRFVLIEVYRSPEDPARHKETLHFAQWVKLAEPMMVEPRTRVVYANLILSNANK